jgi:V/A-type H+-transporting ATPase subunit D
LAVVPTKGNLIEAKKSLLTTKVGYELLDRKRNILIREIMSLLEEASGIQKKIDETFSEAYLSLQKANTQLGICYELSQTVPVENGLKLDFRSVMGVEIPMLSLREQKPYPYFGIAASNSSLDEAYLSFEKVKRLTARLAEVENSIYRLAEAIKKTQKRANALKNILIPSFEETVKTITDALEEKDREDFSRLKVIKSAKLN